MKKQDIKVRINNDAEAKEVRDILLDAGETIWDGSNLIRGLKGFIRLENFVVLNKESWLFTDGIGLTEISIQQLREMLQPKQTVTIEVNAQDLPAIERVLNELAKARVKHPNSFESFTWEKKSSILAEESLEVIKAINDMEFEEAHCEVSQVASVCLRILSGV